MKEINIDVIAEGVAYGHVVKIKNDNLFVAKRKCNNVLDEEAKFEEAVKACVNDLNQINDSENEEFLTVHKMILSDPQLKREVFNEIETNKLDVSYAFDKVIKCYIKKFEEAKSFYLEERNLDFKDIRRRVLQKLNNDYINHIEHDKVILVCDELYPSFLSEFRNTCAGVIAKKGGTTSHGAILCKAREIPFVVSNDIDISDDSEIVIDTRVKKIFVDCASDFISEYKKYKSEISQRIRIRDFSSVGVKIFGNVSHNDELYKIRKYKLHGVGLYRTEVIFMNKDREMTEDEQYEIYKDAVLEMKQRPITFRTFDIGDDKQLSYIKASKKGVTNYKNYPSLFKNQVRAMIRANKFSNMKIMFPMIETYEEFAYLRDLVFKYKKELGSTNYLKIGMMLETKEAINNLDDFKDVDFFSLGTNDLTHELYGIDRQQVSDYKTYIDPLIEVIKKVVEHCKKYNIGLSICGELAGVEEVTHLLLEAGIKNFSVSAANVKSVEKAISNYYEFED